MVTRLGLGIGVVALLLALAAVFLATNQNDDDEPTPGPRWEDSMALVANRPALRICVDVSQAAAADRAQGDALRDTIDEALTGLVDRLRADGYEDIVLDQLRTASVHEGCPPAAALTANSRTTDPKTGLQTVFAGPVDERGADRLRVYHVASEELSDWFGDVRYGLSVEEMYCGGGHSCAPVTNGVYFAPDPAAELAVNAIGAALGFSQALGQ